MKNETDSSIKIKGTCCAHGNKGSNWYHRGWSSSFPAEQPPVFFPSHNTKKAKHLAFYSFINLSWKQTTATLTRQQLALYIIYKKLKYICSRWQTVTTVVVIGMITNFALCLTRVFPISQAVKYFRIINLPTIVHLENKIHITQEGFLINSPDSYSVGDSCLNTVKRFKIKWTLLQLVEPTNNSNRFRDLY